MAVVLLVGSNAAVADVTETSKEGDTLVERTYDSADVRTRKLIMVVRTTETTDPNDSTTVRIKVTTKKYDKGKRPPYETTVVEEEKGLIPGWQTVVKKRTMKTTTYTKTKPRVLVIVVEEEYALERIDEFGVSIYKGKRVTTTGKGAETVEVIDARTGRWVRVGSAPAGQTSNLSPSLPDTTQLPGTVESGELNSNSIDELEPVSEVKAHVVGNISRVDVNSKFGIGTVVFAIGEIYVTSVRRYVDRVGIDIGGEVDLTSPGLVLGPQSYITIDAGFSYASGSASSSGSATVGVGGVSTIGLTLLAPDGVLGTGVSSSFAGDVLDGVVNIDNRWTLGRIGYSEMVTPRGWPDGSEVHVGGAFTFEQFGQDFTAQADILRGGGSLAGQETRGDTTDTYYGIEFKAGVTWPIAENFSVGIEGFVTPSYHTGKASLSQFTDFGGGVTQQFEVSNDGFEVAAGIRANVKYDVSPSVSFKVSAEYSQLPGVGEMFVPANPGEQPLSFGSGSVDRFSAGAEVNISFYSDIRLKRDIVALARLDNGLGLYRYRYLWSDTLYVGVMAQEVATLMPGAVVRGADGYLRVNYARLGLSMQTWDEWAARREKTSDSAAAKLQSPGSRLSSLVENAF